MKIITNNVPRNIIYWYELTPEEQKEFDWINPEYPPDFVRYRGSVYALSEFMRVPPQEKDLKGWDGYSGDSFFSGKLVKYTSDGDQVIMGFYLS